MIRLRILIYLDTPLTILFFILLNMLVLFSSLHMSEINYLPKLANASFSSIPLHIKNIGVMILLPNDFVLPAMYHFFFFENVPYYQSYHIPDLSFLDTTTTETSIYNVPTYTPSLPTSTSSLPVSLTKSSSS